MKSVDPRLALGTLAASLVLGACQDSPSAVEPAPTAAVAASLAPLPTSLASKSAMSALGGVFGDATAPFLAAMREEKERRALQLSLESLSANLAAGNDAAAARDLKAARALLAKVSDTAETSELAPIGLALDNAELVLKGETPGGTPVQSGSAPQP